MLESPLPAGNYLITVEREGIFTEQVRRFEESTAVLEIPIALNYVPVVYVSVCSYSVRSGKPTHQYGEADMDKPKGFFGSTAVFVNPRVKAFSIDVAADKPSYRPGEKAVIVLNATKGGKPLADAELTLMAVDRGVLDLINYHVPNPVDFFYNEYNFPLCVKGGDSRSLLMDPVTYEIKNLKGGDASDEEKEQERKKFDPTAVFIPVLKTDKNGQARAEFTLPDTLTTYRITAFGVHEDLLALQEDEMLVQNPVNVLAVKPRRLRERDTAECGVLISNLDSRAHSITVKAEVRSPQGTDSANGGKSAKSAAGKAAGKAFFDGSAQKTVKVESGAQSTVYFDLAAQKAGEVEVVFSVSSDILKERLVQPLVIEHPFVFETFTATGTVERSASSASEMVFCRFERRFFVGYAGCNPLGDAFVGGQLRVQLSVRLYGTAKCALVALGCFRRLHRYLRFANRSARRKENRKGNLRLVEANSTGRRRFSVLARGYGVEFLRERTHRSFVRARKGTRLQC